MEYLITTPFRKPPMSANEQRRAHYHQQAKAKKEVGDVVQWHATRQGIKDLGPCTVTFIWYVPDKRRRDVDGLGPFCKATCDALVQAGALRDDNSDLVTEVRFRIDKSDTKNPRIEILVSEI